MRRSPRFLLNSRMRRRATNAKRKSKGNLLLPNCSVWEQARSCISPPQVFHIFICNVFVFFTYGIFLLSLRCDFFLSPLQCFLFSQLQSLTMKTSPLHWVRRRAPSPCCCARLWQEEPPSGMADAAPICWSAVHVRRDSFFCANNLLSIKSDNSCVESQYNLFGEMTLNALRSWVHWKHFNNEWKKTFPLSIWKGMKEF